MKRTLLWIGMAGLAAVACGKDDDATPGMEGGACLAGEVCAEPLTCASNVCVDLTEGGTSEGEGPTPGDAGNGVDDGDGISGGDDDSPGSDVGDGGTDDGFDVGDGGRDDAGAEVYCGGDSEACLCGHTADYGPPGGPCSTATVSSPGLCCASEGWPGYGGCSCWHVSCRRLSSDTCYCGLGGVDPEDEPVSSCSADEGVCCSDGTTCTCYTNLTQCVFDGEVEVGSCSVSTLSCDEGEVEACA